ncbi:hypothetical protein HXA32_20395 [Salipaludibacillus agaradhaerens]|uniref:hypothetical protein n=1 Tax=Salipaludibacillus agaradhaerens TaxID=76935 RepID=UPI00215112D1|nr:hypothetical protein [Salipaludibacillus agaradhaerens]MCR6108634.1 hypothetical protein [Salipaludibacillus agaradhaerens]
MQRSRYDVRHRMRMRYAPYITQNPHAVIIHRDDAPYDMKYVRDTHIIRTTYDTIC